MRFYDLPFITPLDFGAVKDGKSYDHDAINRAKAAAVELGKELVFPHGAYKIGEGITFDDDYLSVRFMGNARLVPDTDVLNPLTIGSNTSSPTRMHIERAKVDRGTLSTANENVGIRFLAFNQGTVIAPESRFSKYNFAWTPSAGGSAYNTYINPQAIAGFHNFHIKPTGTGYVNENVFQGGRAFVAAGTVRNMFIDAGGTNVPNNNRFIGMSMEGNAEIKIEVMQGDFNMFLACRMEGPGRDIVFRTQTDYNTVYGGEYNAKVEDYSKNQRNTWFSRYGDHRETGNNSVIAQSRVYTGTKATKPGSAIPISNITQANPGVVTANSHGLSSGDHFVMMQVSGMSELNGKAYQVADATTNTFKLRDELGNDVDTTQCDAYTSGGYIMPGPAISMTVHTQTGSGFSSMHDSYHGRDGADSYAFRNIRLSDGLDRSHLTTDGRLMLARQLYIQQSGWTFNPLILGNTHFWVDNTGTGSRVRAKNGAPTSETDGSVVVEL